MLRIYRHCLRHRSWLLTLRWSCDCMNHFLSPLKNVGWCACGLGSNLSRVEQSWDCVLRHCNFCSLTREQVWVVCLGVVTTTKGAHLHYFIAEIYRVPKTNLVIVPLHAKLNVCHQLKESGAVGGQVSSDSHVWLVCLASREVHYMWESQ